MHRVVPKAKIERRVWCCVHVLFDEVDLFIRKSVWQILALFAILDCWNPIRIKERGRSTEVAPADVQVEALVFWLKLRVATLRQMPLANERCRVTYFFPVSYTHLTLPTICSV